MMKNTYTQKASEITRDWFIIDATGLTVGRLSTEVATLLRGKHKPTYTPSMDGGDNVIIINADKVVFTGNKMKDKKYYRHTGHPGGLKSETAEKIMQRAPERIMESAVKGMLPKNILGRQMYRKLFVYAGSEHPHAAQQPKEYTLKG
ncbi:MAG: 50S ribosomal protein L13 [Mycoplasmatales bacterium]